MKAADGWVKRKTKNAITCADCGTSIVWEKMWGAKFDEYYQKGKSGKRICPDCYQLKNAPVGINPPVLPKEKVTLIVVCPRCHEVAKFSPFMDFGAHKFECLCCQSFIWIEIRTEHQAEVAAKAAETFTKKG